jgi:hypothetical protein
MEWTAAMDEYDSHLKTLLKTTDGITRHELYTIDAEGAEPVFRDAYDVVVAGTSAGTVEAYNQLTISFRTTGGGRARHVIMEQAVAASSTFDRAPLAAGTVKSYADYVVNTGTFIRGRDGYPLGSAASAIGKISDALRKKYRLNT